jgi:hypothetical protein
MRDEHYCEYDKDEAVELHTMDITIRFSGGIDNKIMR